VITSLSLRGAEGAIVIPVVTGAYNSIDEELGSGVFLYYIRFHDKTVADNSSLSDSFNSLASIVRLFRSSPATAGLDRQCAR